MLVCALDVNPMVGSVPRSSRYLISEWNLPDPPHGKSWGILIGLALPRSGDPRRGGSSRAILQGSYAACVICTLYCT